MFKWFCNVKFSSSVVFLTKRVISSNMNKSKCTVAVCQFTATNDKSNNLEIVKRLVAQAVDQNSKIVFLPEACDYIAQCSEETIRLAEPIDGELVREYCHLAQKYAIWLSVGGIHELLPDGKLHNSHLLIDCNGCIKAIYRKLHLFDASIPERKLDLRESDTVKPGEDIVAPVMTPAGLLALSTCYDVRFPELGTLQRKLGAQILTYPSAFALETGQCHWDSLLRCRAIENQCYVTAAAQCGYHNEKRISYGQSMIIDPWGNVLAACPSFKQSAHETRLDDTINQNESIATACIDLDLLHRIRLEMPVFKHRRNDVYALSVCKFESSSQPIDDEQLFQFAHKAIPGSTVFFRSRYSFAFTNIRCVVPGHVLVSSIRIAERLQDLNPEELSDLFQLVVKVQAAVERAWSAKSSTVCIQDGKYAGQTIPHVHVHILPRKQNDFARNDDIYEQLAKHDKPIGEGGSEERPLQDMVKEASMLRDCF